MTTDDLSDVYLLLFHEFVCPYKLNVKGEQIWLVVCYRVAKRGYSTQAPIAPR